MSSARMLLSHIVWICCQQFIFGNDGIIQYPELPQSYAPNRTFNWNLTSSTGAYLVTSLSYKLSFDLGCFGNVLRLTNSSGHVFASACGVSTLQHPPNGVLKITSTDLIITLRTTSYPNISNYGFSLSWEDVPDTSEELICADQPCNDGICTVLTSGGDLQCIQTFFRDGNLLIVCPLDCVSLSFEIHYWIIFPESPTTTLRFTTVSSECIFNPLMVTAAGAPLVTVCGNHGNTSFEVTVVSDVIVIHHHTYNPDYTFNISWNSSDVDMDTDLMCGQQPCGCGDCRITEAAMTCSYSVADDRSCSADGLSGWIESPNYPQVPDIPAFQEVWIVPRAGVSDILFDIEYIDLHHTTSCTNGALQIAHRADSTYLPEDFVFLCGTICENASRRVQYALSSSGEQFLINNYGNIQGSFRMKWKFLNNYAGEPSSLTCGSEHCAHSVQKCYITAGEVLRCSCPAQGASDCVGQAGDGGTPADEVSCLYDPCSNGGQCERPGEIRPCECLSNFTGSKCHIDVNECDNSPCWSGQCNNNIGSFNCVCTLGYSGNLCADNTMLLVMIIVPALCGVVLLIVIALIVWKKCQKTTPTPPVERSNGVVSRDRRYNRREPSTRRPSLTSGLYADIADLGTDSVYECPENPEEGYDILPGDQDCQPQRQDGNQNQYVTAPVRAITNDSASIDGLGLQDEYLETNEERSEAVPGEEPYLVSTQPESDDEAPYRNENVRVPSAITYMDQVLDDYLPAFSVSEMFPRGPDSSHDMTTDDISVELPPYLPPPTQGENKIDDPPCLPPPIPHENETDDRPCLPPPDENETDNPPCLPPPDENGTDDPPCLPPPDENETDDPPCLPPPDENETDDRPCSPPPDENETDDPPCLSPPDENITDGPCEIEMAQFPPENYDGQSVITTTDIRLSDDDSWASDDNGDSNTKPTEETGNETESFPEYQSNNVYPPTQMANDTDIAEVSRLPLSSTDEESDFDDSFDEELPDTSRRQSIFPPTPPIPEDQDGGPDG